MAGGITVDSNFAVDGQKVVVVGMIPAGAALTKGMPVRISGGAAYAADADVCRIANVSDFAGFVVEDADAGMAVAIYGKGTIMRNYADTGEFISGDFLYVSDDAGQLENGKVASSDEPVAVAISVNDILVIK